MRKATIFFALPFALLLSCGDESKHVKENEFSFDDGSPMAIPNAFISQKYSKQDGSGNPGNGFYIAITEKNVFLSKRDGYDVFNGDGFVFVIGLAAAPSESLLPDIYSLSEEPSFPFIFYGRILELEDGHSVWNDEIKTGSVIVTKSGSTYTIEIDAMLSEKKVKAYYQGSLGRILLALNGN